jgi:Flp pilus assembly protein TadB
VLFRAAAQFCPRAFSTNIHDIGFSPGGTERGADFERVKLRGHTRMSRKANRGRNKRLITFAWVGALAVLTIFLIYREMTAVLYILATVGVTGLLIVVALADLSKHEKFSQESPRLRDAAPIGSGLSSSNPTSQR